MFLIAITLSAGRGGIVLLVTARTSVGGLFLCRCVGLVFFASTPTWTAFGASAIGG